jgi:hypothetical protein
MLSVGVGAAAGSAGPAGVEAARGLIPQAIITTIVNKTHATLNVLLFIFFIPKFITGLYPKPAFSILIVQPNKFPERKSG